MNLKKGPATLLEGAGLLFNISSAIFNKNIQIWMNKCVKLEINLRIVNNVLVNEIKL